MTAFLLVFLARDERWLPGSRWIDRNNDPEQRAWPMTYGICRGDFRRKVERGAEIFFVGFDRDGMADGDYHLSSCLVVAEKISQTAAAERFPGRPNVVLDLLPEGRDPLDYAVSHRASLRWPGKSLLLRLADTNQAGARAKAEEQCIQVEGVSYIHAWWDHHADWKTSRLNGEYLVGDAVTSLLVQQPISYRLLLRNCSSLPERLSVGGPYPHRPIPLNTRAAGFLRDCLECSAHRPVPSVSVPPEVDRYRLSTAIRD